MRYDSLVRIVQLFTLYITEVSERRHSNSEDVGGHPQVVENSLSSSWNSTPVPVSVPAGPGASQSVLVPHRPCKPYHKQPCRPRPGGDARDSPGDAQRGPAAGRSQTLLHRPRLRRRPPAPPPPPPAARRRPRSRP